MRVSRSTSCFNPRPLRPLVGVGVLSWVAAIFLASISTAAEPEECVVATVHPLATDAGVTAFEQGGNAVDAAIAAALTLGVVDSHNSGLGGGCFILIHRADGSLLAIDGRETAPAAASRDMYLRDGEAQTQLSQTGPLAVATPGALAAYAMALDQAGKRSLAEPLWRAAEIAEEGFRVDRVLAARLRAQADRLRRFEGSRQALLREDGAPYAEGDWLRQSDLAQSYRAIAQEGTEWFYQGPFAERVGHWMAEHGGVLSAEDFASYRAVVREPVISQYRGYQIVGFPPPSSGGVHVAQILNLLQRFDLAETHQRDAGEAIHYVVEAMKIAFADRAHWLGDADFVDVPRGLIDPDYAAPLAQRIRADRAVEVVAHGTPPRATEDLFGRRHTTHIAAADSAGNWVAITATVNTTFGSKVIVPGTGIVLNNEMDDFSIQPGVPNAFGLIGAEHNAIEPGKRPLSSMSPTLVLSDGQPVITLGAAGGPKIITQVVMALVRHLDFQQPLEEAVAAPRFHHQWRPDQVLAEATAPAEVLAALEQRGHMVETTRQSGITQAIGRDADGRLQGVHDPRVPGKAARGQRSEQ